MAKSIAKPSHRVLAALKLHKTSVPQLARKHGANDKTLYAAINGSRPGKDAKVQRALKEAQRLEEALPNV